MIRLLDVLTVITLLIAMGSLAGAVVWHSPNLAIPSTVCILALAITESTIYRMR